MENTVSRIFRVSAFLIKLASAKIVSVFAKLSPKYRNLWIISERGDDARDNGYFFYKYVRENHPGINIIYVINPDSADAPKVSALGMTVAHNSFGHFVAYCASQVRISSSVWGGDLPYAPYFQKLSPLLSKKRKTVFLQHGIIKDRLQFLMAREVSLDLFVCGARPEADYIAENFGHPSGVVQYTGLARFDNLHSIRTKQQILLMPTFRKWLQKMTDVEVAESEYIAAWNKVLCDKRILAALEKSENELIFYPHYVMQKHIDRFVSTSNRVKIAKFKDYDVQQLLIESKLLVTDFSSVFFDFGYMDKPVIYYQFDRERYIKEHYDYTKGYFDYDEMGFGEVALDHEALVCAVCKSIETDFKTKEKYLRRIKAFFPLYDTCNSERIYERICEIIKNKGI